MKKYLFIIFLLSGCVSVPKIVDIKFYEGPELLNNQVASVGVAYTSPGVRIQIGEKSYTYSDEEFYQYEIYEIVYFKLKPGSYSIYFDEVIRGIGIVSGVCEIELEAGHEYGLTGISKKTDWGYSPYVYIVDKETKSGTECYVY
jgi:hypothetical protein